MAGCTTWAAMPCSESGILRTLNGLYISEAVINRTDP